MSTTGPLTPPQPEPAEPPLVLVIDDDPLITRIVDSVLTKHGFRVRTATDAPWGLAMALRDTPEMILLDYMLPSRNGLGVLEDLRAVPELQGVPVVMMTAHGEKEVVTRAVLYGANDFIVKPFTAKALLDRTERWISRAASAPASAGPASPASAPNASAPASPAAPTASTSASSDGVPPAAPAELPVAAIHASPQAEAPGVSTESAPSP